MGPKKAKNGSPLPASCSSAAHPDWTGDCSNFKIGDKIEWVAEEKCETEELAKHWDEMDPRLKAVMSKEQCSPVPGMKGRIVGCREGEIAVEMLKATTRGQKVLCSQETRNI